MDAMERAREARDRVAVLAELGLPPTTPYHRFRMRRGEAGDWRWEFAHLGADGAPVYEDALPMPGTPWTWPATAVVTVYCVHVQLGPQIRATAPLPLWALTEEQPPLDGFILRATVRHDGAPVYLESRWHPDGVWTESIAGLERPHQQLDRDLAYQLLPLLRQVSQGKAVGDGVESAEAFLRRLDEIAADCRREQLAFSLGRNPEAPGVLQWYPLGHSDFYRRLGLYRAQGHRWARWPDLRRHYASGRPFLSLLGEERTNRDTPAGRRG